MTTILPEGEDLRKAIRWITEERSAYPLKSAKELIEGACLQFDLSPLDAEFVERFVREKLFT
jgi:hypothetical protein